MGSLTKKDKILLGSVVIFIFVASVFLWMWVDTIYPPPGKVMHALITIEGTKINNTSYVYTITIIEWKGEKIKWKSLSIEFDYYNKTGLREWVLDNFTNPKNIHYNTTLKRYIIESTGGGIYLYCSDPYNLSVGDQIIINKSFIKPHVDIRACFDMPPSYLVFFIFNFLIQTGLFMLNVELHG